MTVLDRIKSVLGADPSDRADADMRRVLDTLTSLHPKPLEHLTAQEARLQPTATDAVKKLLQISGASATTGSQIQSRDITIPGAVGNNPARVYMPTAAQGPLPVVLYFHGGGFVIADLDTYDATPRAIAELANVVVVSAHYRQAPEDKFPASHDDACVAWRWIVDHALDVGGDAARIAVMGESAGANLAANVSLFARDNALPMPVCQVLIYPLADTNTHTVSYEENRHAAPLNKPMMLWFVEQLLADPRDKHDKRLQLVDQDLLDMPTTFIVTAGIDPLRSDGEKLARALENAGNRVISRNYDGATHEFFGMASVVEAARDAQAFVAKGLREAFAQTPASASVAGSFAAAGEPMPSRQDRADLRADIDADLQASNGVADFEDAARDENVVSGSPTRIVTGAGADPMR